jgi:predicted ATPase
MRSGFAEGATNTQVLAVDGSNIAEILFYIKNINESVYRRVIDCVRTMEPSLKSINFIAMPNQPLVPFVELSQNPRASWGGLSDGTLRTMGLACIAFQSAMYTDTMSVSPLAIIEEPENGLFPGLLKTVLNWFDDWAPQSQFLFTSHSPFFIDLFDAKRRAVTLLSKKEDRTVCTTPENTEHTLSEDEHLTLSQEYATELFR